MTSAERFLKWQWPLRHEAARDSAGSSQLGNAFGSVPTETHRRTLLQVLQRVGEFAAAHPDTRVLLALSTRDVVAAPVSIWAAVRLQFAAWSGCQSPQSLGLAH